MQNLILDPQETLSERNVVMEERRLRYEDVPQNALFEQVVATAFNVHPYRRPVIGWMSDLANIEREDLFRHYRRYYSPDNAFIVVAGDVSTEEIVEKAREHFAAIEPISSGSGRDLNRVEPAQQGERRVRLRKEAELPYLIAAYHVPPFPEKDGYALAILAHILSGKSGRLYRAVVYDERIALNADAGYSGINTDPFLFFLDATAAPGEEIEDVEEALFEQVEVLKEEPPTNFELQGAKNRLVASFIMGRDSIFNQAMQLGLYEVLGDWRLLYRYVEEIHKVTAKDVSRVAEKYLTRENRTVGILIPEKAEEK
jgi:zinc protease